MENKIYSFITLLQHMTSSSCIVVESCRTISCCWFLNQDNSVKQYQCFTANEGQ